MGWSTGTYSKVWDWESEEDLDREISATKFEEQDTDFEEGINNCLTKDGQNVPTANLPMDGYRHTGVGDGSARNHYTAIGQLMDGEFQYWVTAGTGTNYTITPSPAFGSYGTMTGAVFFVKCHLTNTSTCYLNVNSLGDKEIRRSGSSLVAGDFELGQFYILIYDGTYFEILSHLNSFRQLDDVPAYASNGEKFLVINADEDAIEAVAKPEYEIAVDYYTTGSGNWTCPVGVYSVKVECWGGGGGSDTTDNEYWSSIGQSGCYASSVVAVTPETDYAYAVGAAGTNGTNPTAGTDTTFNSTTVVAKGGGYGGGTQYTGSQCTGDFKLSGNIVPWHVYNNNSDVNDYWGPVAPMLDCGPSGIERTACGGGFRAGDPHSSLNNPGGGLVRLTYIQPKS